MQKDMLLQTLRNRTQVIEMGFEMLTEGFASSMGETEMPLSDIKEALLGLQTICKHQQALIETLFTALTQEPESHMPGAIRKILGKE